MKTIHLHYYAALREQRKASQETVTTSANTARELYDELKPKFGFTFSPDSLKVAINDEFSTWDTPLKTDDSLVFIPPVAGG